MIITNPNGLCPAWFRAVQYLEERRAELMAAAAKADTPVYSVTELLDPPYLYELRRRYGPQLRLDAARCLASLRGSAAHQAIQCWGASKDALFEVEVRHEFPAAVVVGHIDCLEPDGGGYWLQDWKYWKTASVTMRHGRGIAKAQKQVKLYWLLCDKPIHRASIEADFKDWTVARIHESGYPTADWQSIAVEEPKRETAWKWLEHRVNMFVAARETPLEQLTPCSADDRWDQDENYAAFKVNPDGTPTTKSARRCFYVDAEEPSAERRRYATPEEAKNAGAAWCGTQKEPHGVFHRAGLRKRCDDWCHVASVCPEYARYRAEKEKEI